ncbi:methylated-DNA--[protein]-cysteine S-methyltransferase [Acidisoma cellulosilytica]|uniref:Methylated-DNA--protein-cysteine methyltransferase n=1 Tax=Acidisoma cellulosilyticum TaxID=2802395 RepID=A0A963Z793_9PROT|nr:methylated-DNA--[protein]-cysteine S-methyltransferase [Acidisoma cellulosilyticum]MCB8883881.1 methylated-DNA--[protein]-cysteine S-methyltransferase [Acidisoma cellulosilyticum]
MTPVFTHAFTWMESPIGRLKLVASDRGLAAVLWEVDRRAYRHLTDINEDPSHPMLVEAKAQLTDYFAGTGKTFTMPLDFEGKDFQRDVWQALLAIPYGEVRSYGEIARLIGRPKAVRAVGAAAGMNPIAVIAPCHRAIGTNGALTGFAGGLAAKTKLLAIESAETQPSLAF